MRQALRYALASALLLTALGLVAVVFRTTLLEFALERGLAFAGVARAQLHVDRFDWTAAEISGIRLGSELRADRLRLDYRPAELWHGKLRHVALTTPVVDLTRDGAPARLRAFFGGGASGSSATMLPPITIEDGKLRLDSGFGPVTLRIDGTLGQDNMDVVRGRFDVSAEAEAGHLAGDISIEAAPDGRLAAELHIRRGDLSLADLALEGVQLDASFSRSAAGGPRLSAQGGIGTIRYQDQVAAETAIKVSLDGERASLALQGTTFGAPLGLSVDASLDLDQQRLILRRLVADLSLSEADSLPVHFGLPALKSGRLHIHVSAGGPTLALRQPPTSLSDALAWLQRNALDASATLIAEGIAVDGWCKRAELVLGADLRAVDGRLQVTLAAPLLTEVDGLAPDRLSRLPFPLDGPAVLELEPGVVLSLVSGQPLSAEASGTSAFNLTLGGDSAAGTLTVDAALLPRWAPRAITLSRLVVAAHDLELAGQHLTESRYQGTVVLRAGTWSGEGLAQLSMAQPSLGPVAARGLEAELPLTFDAGTRRLELTRSGRLHLIGLRLPGVVALPGRLDLLLSPAKDALLRAAEEDATVNLETSLQKPISLTLQAGRTALAIGAGKLGLVAKLAPSGWRRIEAQLRLDSAGLPDVGLTARDLALDLSLNDPAPSGKMRLSVASVASSDPALPRLPLSLDGSAEFERGRGGFEATLSGGDGLVRARSDGHFDIPAHEITATAALSPLRLDEALSQLKNSWPVLAPVTAMAGRVSADARLAWHGDRLTSGGNLVLEDLSLKTAAVGVRGLSGRIALEPLWPPATREAQRIAVQNLSGPIEVRDAKLLLRLEPMPGRTIGRVVLERADAATDLAQVTAGEGIFDPIAGRHGLTLQIGDLDLARLLALAKIDGLSGTGRLAGSLRAEYRDGKLIIPPARLASTGPGVLRFTSVAASRALASGGEQVALLLKALEDFRYESLTLGLEKRADGNGQAKLSLRGSNPEVLDGYPFAINIDVSADFDNLLATLLQAYDLSGKALRATVK